MANINISGQLHSTVEIQGDALHSHVVAGAEEILDESIEAKQSDINGSFENRIHSLEGSSVSYSDQEPTQTEQAQARDNIDVYSKNEVNQIASAFTGQNYVTVQATSGTTAADIATLINATGGGEQTDTIYRVAFFDGSAYDVTKYSEYTWNGTAYVQLNVRSGVEDIFDISVYNTSGGQAAVYDNLAVALAGVPGDVKRGGMSVKFIQRVPAKYSVVVTTSDTQPTGTALSSASSVTSGTYEAAALTDFSTLPSATGSGNAFVYYYADGTTYTVWTITMASTQGSEYVQYRLMATAWSTTPSDLQGVDAEPTAVSRNLVESGGVFNKIYRQVPQEAVQVYQRSALGDDGSLVPNSSSNVRVRAYSIDPNKSYIANGTISNAANTCGIYYYDEDGIPISGELFRETNNWVEFTNYKLTIPPTAAQVKVAGHSSYTTASLSGVLSVFDCVDAETERASEAESGLNGRLTNVESNINSAKNILGSDFVDTGSQLTMNVGRINKNGTIQADSGYSYSNPFAVEKGDCVYVFSSKSMVKGYGAVFAVTGEGTIESPYVYTPRLTFSNNWQSFLYISDYDENIVISFRNSSDSSYHVFKSEAYKELIRKLDNSVSTVMGEISSNRNEIDEDILDLENKVIGNEYGSNDKTWIKRIFTYTKGDIDNTTGTNISANNKVRSDQLLYVGDSYRIKIKIDGCLRLRFYYYDKNKQFIGYSAINAASEATLYRYIQTGHKLGYNVNTYKAGESGVTSFDISTYVKYVRFTFFNGSTSITPEIVENNIEISTISLFAHYFNPKLNDNSLVTCFAHTGVGLGITSDGTWRSAGNNLLSSFYGAYKQGFNGVLVNTLKTSDGEIVCSHEGTFTDAITGNTITIGEITYAELITHPFLPNGECIPKLDDVLYLCKMLGLKVFLVNVGADSVAMYNMVSKYQMRDNVIFMTNAKTILNLYPYAHIALVQEHLSGDASTAYQEIADLITTATARVTEFPNCKVTLWLVSGHSVGNLQQACQNLPVRTDIGCFHLEGDDLTEKLPYVNVMSHASQSLGSSSYIIEAALAEKYPEIINRQLCNEIT